MLLNPGLLLRVSVALLLAAIGFGLVRNLQVARARPVPPASANTAADQPLRFVLVGPQLDHPVWDQVAEGAKSAGAQLNIDVEYTAARRASVDEQVRLVDMAAAAQVDGIITQGVLDQRLAEAIAHAIDRGVPVITVATDLPGRRLAYVGGDNYAAGRQAAQALIQRSGGKAVVCIMHGDLGPVGQDDRVRGFRDELATAPGMRLLSIVDTGLSRSTAGYETLKVLDLNPEVTAFYGTTALDTLGIAQSVAARQAQGRVLVVGWDYADGSGDSFGRGIVTVALTQDARAMGSRAVQELEAYLRRDLRPVQTGIIAVTLHIGGGQR